MQRSEFRNSTGLRPARNSEENASASHVHDIFAIISGRDSSLQGKECRRYASGACEYAHKETALIKLLRLLESAKSTLGERSLQTFPACT